MKKNITELDIIEILIRTLGQPSPPYSKIGDDVAYFPIKNGQLVVKSDMLVGKTDVPRQMKLWQAARKSVVTCVSDFAAKGVVPSALLISLGLPRSITKKDVVELAGGFKKAKKEFSIEVIGGDTNEADDLIIDCTVLGFSDNVVKRCGAHPGDVIVVSGIFGYSASGMMILSRGLRAESESKRRMISSVLNPQARLELGLALSKLLSASIDSSDGLALSLYEIAHNSNVGIRITNLPIDAHVKRFADENNIQIEDLVLYGGEEYEIVASVPRDRLKEAKKAATAVGHQLIEIGYAYGGEPNVTASMPQGTLPVERRGWIHFT